MNFLDNFSLERFMFSLQYMWKGMLCIFIVIAAIILVIFGVNRLAGSISDKKKTDSEGADNC